MPAASTIRSPRQELAPGTQTAEKSLPMKTAGTMGPTLLQMPTVGGPVDIVRKALNTTAAEWMGATDMTSAVQTSFRYKSKHT